MGRKQTMNERNEKSRMHPSLTLVNQACNSLLEISSTVPLMNI